MITPPSGVGLALALLVASLAADMPPKPATAPLAEAVTVRAPAPRLWKLSRGAATVYILGATRPLPRGLDWSTVGVRRVLARADRVVIAPVVTLGPLTMLGLIGMGRLPPGQSLSKILPADLKARVRARLQRLGRPADSLDRYQPGWAGFLLQRAVSLDGPADDQEPYATVERLARARHVRIEAAARYYRGAMLRRCIDMPVADGEALLSDVVARAEFDDANVAAVGRAWSAGDLAALRRFAPQPGLWRMLTDHVPDGGVRQSAVEDSVAAIDHALARGGVTLVVIEVGAVVGADGAFEHFRRQGVAVEEPTD